VSVRGFGLGLVASDLLWIRWLAAPPLGAFAGTRPETLCPISVGIQASTRSEQHWNCTSRFHDHPSPYILYFIGTVIYGNACNLA
jgi:hypothetical protein